MWRSLKRSKRSTVSTLSKRWLRQRAVFMLATDTWAPAHDDVGNDAIVAHVVGAAGHEAEEKLHLPIAGQALALAADQPADTTAIYVVNGDQWRLLDDASMEIRNREHKVGMMLYLRMRDGMPIPAEVRTAVTNRLDRVIIIADNADVHDSRRWQVVALELTPPHDPSMPFADRGQPSR